jgi:hypothetical protein
MSKKELATIAENGGALAVAAASAADFGGGLVVQGKSEAGLNLSRVVLYQGTAEEDEMYGSHKRGTFLDALEVRELGTAIKVMPIFAFATWSIWEEGSRAPVQTWRDQNAVPREMLEWSEVGGKRTPPQAQEAINVVCAVEGEPWPYLFVFKRTGLKAWGRTIQPLEARRGSIGKCPGLYELGSTDDKNADGKPFKRLSARPAGEPTAETVELAKKVFAAQQHLKEKAAEMAETEPGEVDPDTLGR